MTPHSGTKSQISSKAVASEQFANDVAEQARERFGEGRELLQRVRTKVRNYGADVLAPQLNATRGMRFCS